MKKNYSDENRKYDMRICRGWTRPYEGCNQRRKGAFSDALTEDTKKQFNSDRRQDEILSPTGEATLKGDIRFDKSAKDWGPRIVGMQIGWR